MKSEKRGFNIDTQKIEERAKELVREGNARRIVVEREGKTIAQAPLTFGVVGAVLAPALAVALGLVALFTRSTVRIEQSEQSAPPKDEPSRLPDRFASGQ